MWQPCNSMQSHGITVKEKWLYYILYMLISQQVYIKQGFPGGSVVKNLPASAGDTGSIPGPGRCHMPQSSEAHAPQLLSLCSGA